MSRKKPIRHDYMLMRIDKAKKKCIPKDYAYMVFLEIEEYLKQLGLEA